MHPRSSSCWMMWLAMKPVPPAMVSVRQARLMGGKTHL